MCWHTVIFRRNHILDDLVPPEVPVPALAEVQVALQEAAARVTGEWGEALKQRLRTGTYGVVPDDHNWGTSLVARAAAH